MARRPKTRSYPSGNIKARRAGRALIGYYNKKKIPYAHNYDKFSGVNTIKRKKKR